MGYTHYWNNTPTVHEDCLKHIKRIVNDGRRKGIIAFENDVDKRPAANCFHVRFNGVGDQGHETFLLEFGKDSFEFCKTAQKPYDVYVVAVLAALEYWYGFEWSSDGERIDFYDGIHLMMKKL